MDGRRSGGAPSAEQAEGTAAQDQQEGRGLGDKDRRDIQLLQLHVVSRALLSADDGEVVAGGQEGRDDRLAEAGSQGEAVGVAVGDAVDAEESISVAPTFEWGMPGKK